MEPSRKLSKGCGDENTFVFAIRTSIVASLLLWGCFEGGMVVTILVVDNTGRMQWTHSP